MGANSKPAPPAAPSPRFQIASRLGGFKDTITVGDPFGTPARFTLYRSGSNAHREFARQQIDRDPVALVGVEQMILGSDSMTALTDEESAAVEEARSRQESDDTARGLVPVIDRLTTATVERTFKREAVRKLLEGGKMRPSDVLRRGSDEELAEALFLLRSWEDMPGEDGSAIPFSAAAARDLLTNDTALEGAGIDDLVLGQEAWTRKAATEGEGEGEGGDGATPSATAARIILTGLTLGRAYLLYFLAVSRNAALFRNQLMEEAGKNFEPSSGSIASSGDEKSETAN